MFSPLRRLRLMTWGFRSGDVVLEGITFANCSLDDARVHGAIVEVADCSMASRSNDIVLRHVHFQQNALRGGAAIDVGHPACASVEMRDVTFSLNECSGACFGRLAANNILKNVRMERNMKSDDDEHVFAMLSLPSESDTQATGLIAKGNELTVVLDDSGAAKLELKKSKFVGNRGRSAIHLMGTKEVMISNCSFSRNAAEGLSGAGLFSKSVERLDMSNCNFEENVANEGGAITSENTSLRIEHCDFIGNRAEENGGAIFVRGGDLKMSSYSRCTTNTANTSAGCIYLSQMDRFRIERTNFTQNKAIEEGGALTVRESKGRMQHCILEKNRANSGGAMSIARRSKIKIMESDILANNASLHEGGGIWIKEESSITLINVTLDENSAAKYGGSISMSHSNLIARNMTIQNGSCAMNKGCGGGGIRANDGSQLRIFDSTFLNNSASYGGSLSFKKASVHVRRSDFNDSHVTARGGALNVEVGSTLVLKQSKIKGNAANLTGGGIRCRSANVTMHRGHLLDNKADKHGGGIIASDACTVMMNGTVVRRNRAKRYGGGLCLKLKTVTNLADIIFEGNTAEANGGAIYVNVTPSAPITITTCTFGRNAAKNGGSIALRESTAKIEDSDFARGSAESGGGCLYMDHHSHVELYEVKMARCRSDNGGAIHVKESVLSAEQLKIRHCRANRSGAGVFSAQRSEMRCSVCRFEENHADSTGGAISILSHSDPLRRAYQFFHCRFRENRALVGGARRRDACKKCNRSTFV